MTVIGIDLGGTSIKIGKIEENNLIKSDIKDLDAKASKEEVINQITQMIDSYYDSEVEGIGIGVPAIVDTKTGTVYEVVNIPSWDEVPLKNILEDKYKIPVLVNNDANCFALGEKYFGEGKDYDDVVGLITGTGVGAGIIINGKLYSGQDCAAGEFGEIIYLDKNIEEYCSGKFFQDNYNAKGEKLFEKQDKKAFEEKV